jgi:competence protein ComGC
MPEPSVEDSISHLLKKSDKLWAKLSYMSSVVIVIQLVLVFRPNCASEKEGVNQKGVNKRWYSL